MLILDLIQLQENTPLTAGYLRTVRHSIQPSLTHSQIYGPALLNNTARWAQQYRAVLSLTRLYSAIVSSQNKLQ
jgi:hypothetical protein